MIRLLLAIIRYPVGPQPIDWNARLEADRSVRMQLVGIPYAKRRTAALKATRPN